MEFCVPTRFVLLCVCEFHHRHPMVLDPDAMAQELAEASVEIEEAEAEFVAMCEFYNSNAALVHMHGKEAV